MVARFKKEVSYIPANEAKVHYHGHSPSLEEAGGSCMCSVFIQMISDAYMLTTATTSSNEFPFSPFLIRNCTRRLLQEDF